MIKNYFLLFVRNLRRQKLFSLINLIGLSVSITSVLIIYLYVNHELSYDKFHPQANRIYRINQTFIWGENDNNQFSSTGPGVAYAVREEIPEVALMTSIHTPGNFIMSYSKPDHTVVSFEEKKVFAADSNFFSMFSFPLIQGNEKSAFAQANNLVMTKSTAQKYFGNENPIGKLILLSGGVQGENNKTYEVTGVVEDLPDNSYFDFDILLSMKAYPIERLSWSWVWTQLETYVRLQPQADIEQVRKKLSTIPRKHAEETLRGVFKTTWDEYIQSGKKWELFLQPLTDIHTPSTNVINRLNDVVNINIIYSFIGAAVFIVVLACVNFMNLSTAQFTRRVKEASVRKILGLNKKQLSAGYFFEALIFCVAAFAVAIGLTQLFLPGFNLITEKSLRLDLFGNPQILVSMLILVFVMAVISSSYPAFFLSSFNPVEAIKGKLKVGREGRLFRNGLVIFQFSASIVLIICTGIVFQQLRYVSAKDIGFDRQNLLVLNHVEAVKNGEDIANSVLKVQGVIDASWCRSVPPRFFGGDSFTAEGASEQTLPLNFTNADEKFIPTLGIKMKIGRNFSPDVPGDVNRVILNEAAVKKIGWALDESVLGMRIRQIGDTASYEVVGVVADFNYWSLTAAIEPMAIFHIKTHGVDPGDGQYLVLRIGAQGSDAWQHTIASLQALWKQHAGDVPFDYSFVDQSFAETFKSQQQFGNVLTIMATLAILIACLGLLGMIIYALEQRTKEIGIRKVSGATMMDILTLISKGYTRLIIIAFVVGAPVSYWIMDRWLKDFPYKVTPSVWIFLVTGVSIWIIAILITSYHSIKAALTNPVDVLKDE